MIKVDSSFINKNDNLGNYWSLKPMGGEKPIEYKKEILDYIIYKEFGEEEVKEEDLSYELKQEMVNNYKYDILSYEFMDKNEDFHFVKVYLLKDYDIKFPMYNFEDIKEIFIELLGDGASQIRGFSEDDELSPNFFIEKMIDSLEDVFKINYDEEIDVYLHEDQGDYFLPEIEEKLMEMKEGK